MARLTKQEAFRLGYEHGGEMARESGSCDAGSDGWDGMLVNADPTFAREKFGWDGQDSDEQAVELLTEYCKGCQAGANAACNSQSSRPSVTYEFTGVVSLHACKAAIVAARVMERLENTDLREVWREVVEELGDDWDKESLFAVLHNCSFSAE